MKSSLLPFAAFSIAARALPLCQAASVSFASSIIPPSSDGSFLDNPTGTGANVVLAAVSFGPARTAPYTYEAPPAASNPNPSPMLNGLNFSSSSVPDHPSNVFYSIGQSVSTNPIGYDSGRFSNVPFTNQPLYGLLYDVVRTGSNDSRMTFDLMSLNVGTVYQLQLVFSTLNLADNPAGNPADRNVQIAAGDFTPGGNVQTGTGSDGTSATYAYGPTTGAREVTIHFTADDSTEAFTLLSGSTDGNSRVSLAAFVLSAIPEPSSGILALAGGAALATRRRRR